MIACDKSVKVVGVRAKATASGPMTNHDANIVNTRESKDKASEQPDYLALD